jgi:hypothetical protein
MADLLMRDAEALHDALAEPGGEVRVALSRAGEPATCRRRPDPNRPHWGGGGSLAVWRSGCLWLTHSLSTCRP